MDCVKLKKCTHNCCIKNKGLILNNQHTHMVLHYLKKKLIVLSPYILISRRILLGNQFSYMFIAASEKQY